MGEVQLEVQIGCNTCVIKSIILVPLKSPLARMEERERKREHQKASVDAGQPWDTKTLRGGQNVQFS
jgi:hypothetical protein